MALKNVKSSLKGISKSLKTSNESREFLIKNTRDVVILCSHSIIAAHKGDLKLARQKIKKAESVLKVNQKKAKNEYKKYLPVNLDFCIINLFSFAPSQNTLESLSIIKLNIYFFSLDSIVVAALDKTPPVPWQRILFNSFLICLSPHSPQSCLQPSIKVNMLYMPGWQ